MGRKKLPWTQRKRKMWFVLAVDPGMDSYVKKDLRKEVKKRNLEKVVGRIVIPRGAQTVWIKDKEVRQNRMLFPGYLVVHCMFNDDVFHLFNSVQGCKGLLMNPREPIPLTDYEAALVFLREKVVKSKDNTCQIEQTPVSFKWKEGDEVIVQDSPWAGFAGKVVKVQNNRAVVELQLMGRTTKVAFTEKELVRI